MNEESLFEEALGRSREDRAAFLEQACAGRPELKAAVEALLAAHGKPGNVLDQPSGQTVVSGGGDARSHVTLQQTREPASASSPAASTADYRPMSEAGVMIAGRYTLQQLIGEGGMGEVWVAKQTEPVKRKVALKLIKPGMDSRAVLQRFEHERQALALMDHPNIARVLDGGLTHNGQPFFVMELVNGLPLSKFCDETRLTPRERLELFVPIWQAVQHAHQKGIVHRDLKPANILVTMIDGKPVPKVIDFGVAKATGGKLIDDSLSTQFGSVVGTLEYMSPEQAGYSGADIDTRADIYSLGVILYELLTGLRPLDARQLRDAALTEMIRIIREEEPSRPSTRLSTEDSLPSLAALRKIEPQRLMAMLRGELDWVVMKCLEKSRERRYETANALARDVQRYLADEAVEARPPSAAYHFGKFLRRNRVSVIAASLVLLALFAGVIGTTFGLIRAQTARAAEARRAEGERQAKLEAQAAQNAEANERAQAVIERDKAVAAESKTKAINDFLTQDLLTQAEPANSAAEDHVTLLEVLDRAASKVGQRFAGQPELESALRRTIASTYHGLASWEKAEAQLRSLLEAARKRDPHSAEFYVALSDLAHVLHHRGRTDAEVIKMAQTAADGLQRTVGFEDPCTLFALSYLARAYLGAGKTTEAIALLEHIRDAAAAHLGPDEHLTLTVLANLAVAYMKAGKLSEAITLLERVRQAAIAKLGRDHPDTLGALSNLASAYERAGRLADAIALLERVCDASIAKLGPDHPATQTNFYNLAGVYKVAGKHREAIKPLKRIADARIVKLGHDHPDTLTVLNDLGEAYWQANQLDKAVPLFEDVLKRREASLGRRDPATQLTVANLGVNYADSGRLNEAIPLLEEAYGASSNVPSLRWVATQLAMAYQAAGRLDQAIDLFERIRADHVANLGLEHVDTLGVSTYLARAYNVAGKHQKAVALLERVREIQIAKLGSDHPDTLATLDHLAGAYMAAGKLPDAIALLEGVRDVRVAKLGPDHPETMTTLNNLATAYWSAKRLDRSVPLFEDVLTRKVARFGRQHRDTQITVGNLGVNYKDSGRLEQAIPLLEESCRASSRFQELRWIPTQLLDAYLKAGRPADAAKLTDDILADVRKTARNDSPQLAAALAQHGLILLQAKAYADAEPVLREALAIRQKTQPDLWITFTAKSMLGGALLGQKKYAEAEPLLIDGYDGMKRREATIPPLAKARLTDALERLVQLYEATGKREEAALWRKELDARNTVGKPAEKKP
jgi:serine/threonine protein kinase